MGRALITSAWSVLASATLLLGVFPGAVGVALPAQIHPGELIVANVRLAPSAVRLDRIDPITRAITTLSSGGLLLNPIDLCATPDGAVLVVDGETGVVRVEPASGAQSVLVSAASLGGAQPLGIEVEPSGSLLVSAWWRDGSHPAAVFRISGAHVATLSSGGYLRGPSGIVRGADGDVYVADPIEPPGSYLAPARGSVVRIDPATGEQKRRYVSNLFLGPNHITRLQDGSLALAQYGAMQAGYGGGILRLDPATGAVTTLVGTNACSGVASNDGGDLLYYSHIVTAHPRQTYVTRRHEASWGVNDIVGPMTVVSGTQAVPVVPVTWGKLKARYR